MKTPREYLAAACQVDPCNLRPNLHSWIEPAEQAIAAALQESGEEVRKLDKELAQYKALVEAQKIIINGHLQKSTQIIKTLLEFPEYKVAEQNFLNSINP